INTTPALFSITPFEREIISLNPRKPIPEKPASYQTTNNININKPPVALLNIVNSAPIKPSRV
ncbi:hypothetical protein, partial [Enterobacter hormaechei]